MRRFSIRDLSWLILLVAILLVWWTESSLEEREMNSMRMAVVVAEGKFAVANTQTSKLKDELSSAQQDYYREFVERSDLMKELEKVKRELEEARSRINTLKPAESQKANSN